MSETARVGTNCRFCGYLCGLIATVEDGRVTDIEPDPSRYPFDASLQNGCRRWKVNLEFLNHPDRVNYPLKRVGERGSGKWQRLPWDEAMEEIASRLQDLKERYNAETLATSIGGPHATYWPLHRFLSLFGSPNNIGIGQICWNPGVWINSLTYGWPIENELDPDTTACAILWGTNPAESDNSLFWRTIVQFSRMDKPLIVVDPRQTSTAMRADLWLPVRPGTDAFLALGMLQVILAEKLYDLSFVERWCYGFGELEKHVSTYPPDVVAGITGIEAGKICEAARLYALHSPASLISGRGIDQLGRNSAPAHQALAILRAVTGNLDLAGASHLCEMPSFTPEVDLELSAALSETQRMKGLNQGRLLLQSYRGYEHVQKYTQLHDKCLPMRYLTSTHPNLAWQAMLTGKPYPVRALIVMGSNPLLTQADTHLVYQALRSLDLLVVLEFFKTPTAMLADYILPSAGAMERPLFQTHAGIANIAYGGEQAVQPYYERRSDFDFWMDLGLRLGQENGWPWKTFHESLEATLASGSTTWRQFCESGLHRVPSPYHKHDQIDPATGAERGFATPSRKVELWSQSLADLGYEPLPTPGVAPVSHDEFSLLLITGARKQPFNASALRQMQGLRTVHPEPWAEMSARTAARLGLADGCPVLVETEYGKARFILKIAPMREDVVSVEYGWWYPEMPACEPELGGVWVSNANVLTNANIETSDPLIGTWTYNGLPCRVFAVEAAMEIIYER